MSDIMHLMELFTASSGPNECQTQSEQGGIINSETERGRRWGKLPLFTVWILMVWFVLFFCFFVILVGGATKVDRIWKTAPPARRRLASSTGEMTAESSVLPLCNDENDERLEPLLIRHALCATTCDGSRLQQGAFIWILFPGTKHHSED